MYLIARGWGLAPDDFWNMTFAEFTLEFELRRPREDDHDLPGSLVRADIDDLKNWNPE
ncbi:tail assembly chaperone [Defluviimonas denitrificans]|jgi:hypothetical protein|uniref:Tail assembly chaperone n=1 Tax=Albidovulum denitrificans TaxID=404881 RepID=A0A2S8RWH1_9RHOB|nr:phage tail assembly chaperone [Defluviimonas denitrificans]PQV52895.1 tail assembly chaperone [Defluviimonas denitrificans]